jgi:Lon protease-like protein
MDMAKVCLRDNTPFGVCAIREGAEVGAPAIPHDIGTLARIGDWEMPQLGVLQVIAQGERRFRILERRVEPSGLQRARVELLAPEQDATVPASCVLCSRLLERVIEQQPDVLPPPHRFDSCAWIGARLVELLPLALHTKQELLELSDPVARLERLNALLRSNTQPAS